MISQESLFLVEDTTRSERSLHTPGDFVKQNLLYVQEVGFLQSIKPHSCVREKLDSYLFFVVLEGKGSLDVQDRHYELSARDCVLVDCMDHYKHRSAEQDSWKLAWVHFNGQGAKGYYELFLKNNKNENVFQTVDTESWERRIRQLLDLQKDKSLSAELHCGELLLQLVNSVIDELMNDFSTDSRQQADMLRKYLNDQYERSDVAADAEKVLGKTLCELNIDFKKYFGISIEEYVNNRRLTAAKELLRFSIKPIADIAIECGIGDAAIMQQMFREKENMTAEEYRMKWAQWIR